MIKSPAINRIKTTAEVHEKTWAKPGSKALRLRPGQILSGKVMQTRGDGRFLITAGNKSFEAHSALSLNEGERYQFLVRSTGPQIELKVLGSGDPFPDTALKVWVTGKEMCKGFSTILRKLSEGPMAAHPDKTFSKTFQQIRRLLPLMLYQGPGQDDAFTIPQRLLASGIFWENKVLRQLLSPENGKTIETLRTEDLKGLLLKLREELLAGGKTPRDLRTTMEQVDRLLAIIQNHQDLNLSTLREGWGWYWFIPGADEREFLHGEAFARKSGDEETHHIEMNLAFTRLGEIWFSGLLRDGEVSVEIRAETARAATFLEKHLPILEKGLKQKGLKIKRLVCTQIPEGSSFNPFEGETGPSSSAVDVVI